ncbi:DUF6499 domain-containing protein [uncultured Methylobacterium sp.]|uniref:transcriptional regulator domain-containing protein n=1 Tax=uncultured Methylobacterium sp. TaxID=157278 RepID=UPI00260F5F3E|nr:DUF6499 domain-containing protein [uncultured Methylobacterium sp.]
MSEEGSWRSEAAYDYVDTLSPGDLAWEFLRRNTEYRRSYDEFLQAGEITEELTREFTSRWGLRFRGRSVGICDRFARLLGRPPRSHGHRSQQNPRRVRASLT